MWCEWVWGRGEVISHYSNVFNHPFPLFLSIMLTQHRTAVQRALNLTTSHPPSHCGRDFILQVVRLPAVVAGNSIGGFIATSCAADYPDLVQGLVLLNR